MNAFNHACLNNLIGLNLNMFKRFKHDSSGGSLGLNRKCLNIGAFEQFKQTLSHWWVGEWGQIAQQNKNAEG